MTSVESVQALESALEQLLDDYRDLQAHHVTVLSEPPSSLEALRMIHTGHPVLIEGFSPLSSGLENYDWSQPEVYKQLSENKPVTVAVTDDGLADSVRTLPNRSTTFVKPLEEKMTISDLISRLGPKGESSKHAYYLQSQDGNIYRSEPHPSGLPELDMFQSYIARDVQWMKEAIGSKAEAVNLWIGDSKSTTSLHHDPYENIYHVLAGSKTFTLLSPIEGLWLDQHFHPASTLKRTSSGHLVPILDPPPTYPVPWVSSSDFPDRLSPVRVTLHEGQSLFLPAGWWHRVEQQEGTSGIVVAVNYWYTADIHPQTYAYENFARRVARLAGREGVISAPGE
ncbi:hypothetical protein CI109_103060 [Kwoniella shandongensis]|uniref:Uncharacterized protein n=1 Tax=Kwoniella shandongensis TaxID=1734106 RepID=A0A5M6C9Z8_9TREE|nr:uncharacterized protein CI109_000251 [Kwoniella shandongensis]KAA5531410.1 hypothetical protein CI109_000251 [Kwoniella shandongensis]